MWGVSKDSATAVVAPAIGVGEGMDASRPALAEPAGADGETVAADHGARVVLFDFDGVLVRGDLFRRFLEQRFAGQPWRLFLLLPVLAVLLIAVMLPPARPLAVRALIAAGLFGSSPSALRQRLEHWGRQQARLPGSMIRAGVLALRRHLSAGDRVVVVTGCEETLARALLSEVGLADVDVIGSRLAESWRGARMQWHNVGRNKVASLSRMGIHAPWAVAYSDCRRDTPLLKEAAEPVLVNADPALCRLMERRLGRPLQRVEWR